MSHFSIPIKTYRIAKPYRHSLAYKLDTSTRASIHYVL